MENKRCDRQTNPASRKNQLLNRLRGKKSLKSWLKYVFIRLSYFEAEALTVFCQCFSGDIIKKHLVDLPLLVDSLLRGGKKYPIYSLHIERSALPQEQKERLFYLFVCVFALYKAKADSR
ncbi:MAG: hypothetical protein ACOZBH_01900 [Patescibacteria group bacterium]